MRETKISAVAWQPHDESGSTCETPIIAVVVQFRVSFREVLVVKDRASVAFGPVSGRYCQDERVSKFRSNLFALIQVVL